MLKPFSQIKTLFTAVSLLTFYFLAIFIHACQFNKGSCSLKWRRAATTSVTDDNNGHEQLLTPVEMQYMLHNGQVENNEDDMITMVAKRMSNWRNLSDIRSRLTRPDSLKPIRLVGNYSNHMIEEFSENGKSKLIDERLNGRQNGFFVECGAHDGEVNSNSLFFELRRNWTGLLIEPDPVAYKKMLGKNRQAYTFNGCLSPTGRPYESPFVSAGIYGGIRRKMPRKFSRVITTFKIPFKVILVKCFPLVDILDAIGVHHIDFLSLDIEGPELNVLETIDWSRIRIDIMTVEIHGDMKKLNDSRLLMKRIGGYREVGLQGLDVVYERTDLNVS